MSFFHISIPLMYSGATFGFALPFVTETRTIVFHACAGRIADNEFGCQPATTLTPAEI
jgi:hypothetical protein